MNFDLMRHEFRLHYMETMARLKNKRIARTFLATLMNPFQLISGKELETIIFSP